MNKDQKVLAEQSLKKTLDALTLVEASVTGIKPFDPKAQYTPKEREPYDALSDRFIRAVEICIKFLRSYEKLMYAENSNTIRDLFNRMEKIELISSTELWLNMRDVRNRIVHDYTPEQIHKMYSSITGEFWQELSSFRNQAKMKIIA